MPSSRIHRLLRLITLLQSGEPRSAAELMETLGVSRRTLFRDLNAMKEAGVPYYHEAGRGYRIKASFFLPPIHLTVPETLGLMILTKTASGHRNRPLVAAAMSAIYKIISCVPDPMRGACAELMSGVAVEPGPVLDSAEETQVYAVLQRCVDEQSACRISYKSPVDSEVMRGVLHPYLLYHASRAWYVIGKSVQHGEVRMFKLIRFHSVERLEQRFEKPDDFSIRDVLGNAWNLIPNETSHEVELDFMPMVATNVSEVRWHPTQEHEMLPDGRCRMRFTVDGLDEIAWWVCGYADQVVINRPEALRERVREMLERAVHNHGSGSRDGVFGGSKAIPLLTPTPAGR